MFLRILQLLVCIYCKNIWVLRDVFKECVLFLFVYTNYIPLNYYFNFKRQSICLSLLYLFVFLRRFVDPYPASRLFSKQCFIQYSFWLGFFLSAWLVSAEL